MKLKKAEILIGSLIGLLFWISGFNVQAQCPTPGATTINVVDEQCFNANDGILTFTFSDGVYPSAFDYRVRVWNFDAGSYVYDDNNPPFLNTMPAPSIVADVLTFTDVPPGDYILVLDGGSCTNQSYGVNFSGAPNNGMRVTAATDIIIDGASIATTGNDQCNAPFTGEIDATGTVSGGAGGYEYSIDGGATYQSSEIFSSIEHGSYTLTVRDANGCIKEETGIVVSDDRTPPTAGITPNPASVCAGENLNLNGNPAGGVGAYTHSWTGDVSLLSATNIPNPVLNSAASGSFSLTYTVTDANGCSASSSITVTVNTPPVVTDQTPEVCADVAGGTQATGVDLTANNAAIDGGAGYTINWYEDAGLTTAVASPANATVNDGDVFYAEVIDGNGCSAVATATYSVISAPLAPTNLATANIVCDGFDINWDAAATATSYRIEVDDDPLFGSQELNITQTATTVNVSGLILGTTYNIRITPINSCGDGTAATTTETTADVPAALTNLVSANPFCDGFDLSWDASTGAADYLVEIDDDPAFGSIDVSVAEAGTTYTATGLMQGITYYYRVTPRNSCGDGTAASGDETTTDVPAALTNLLSANPVCDGFDLSWDASLGAVDYLVEIDDDPAFGSIDVSVSEAGTTYTASGLAVGTTYYYRVTPRNSCGDGTAASGDETTTDVPAALANLVSANPVCDGFDLSWDASTGATDYLVEIDDDPAFGSVDISVTQAGTAYTASGLSQNTTYYYRVTPSNTCGDGTAASGDATTTDVPAALTNLVSANPVCDGFDLSWDTSLGAVDYLVEIDDDPAFGSIDVSVAEVGTTHTASGLAVGTTYYYRVTPRNSCGDGTAASGDETTTDVPAALANLVSANPVCDGFDLSWDASTGATDYLVEIDDDPAFGSVDISVTQAGTAYTASGLSQNTTYYYRVTPSNTCGDGTAASGDATTTDVPAALTNLVSANPVCDGFDLSWDTSLGAVDYLVEIDDDPAFGSIDVSVAEIGTTYTANGLAIGTTYYYRVTPRNTCGDGTAASGDETTTDVPVALSNLVSANAACDGFDLSWDASLGAVDYLVEIDDDPAFGSIDVSVAQAGTAYTASGLSQNTTYYYRVTPRNTCGDGTAASGDETTGDVPAVLLNLQVSNISCEGFTTQWDPVVGVTYEIQLSTDNFATTTTNNPSDEDFSYDATDGIVANTTYQWRVRAVNACGPSAWAVGADVTTDALPVVTDQTPQLCSDVAGGTFTSGVDLTALQTSIDGGAGLPFAWFEDAGLTTPVTDPTNVTVNDGDDFYTEVGSGNCTSVAQVNYTVNPLDDATFSYAGDPYCQFSANVSPTISGDAGTFSSTAGLVFTDTSTGEIDLTNSTPGSYTITYTTSGTCPAVATQSVTIDPASDPTFSYASGTFCQDAGLQLPTVNEAGGTFSSTPGIVLNASTGEIDPLTSTPATYTVTYAFGGSCPTSATFDVTITTAPDATFSYTGSPFCQSDADPSPVFGAGASAGTFSASPAGLTINSSTGVIDLSASTPGTYTVTNTITAVGACAGTSHDEVIEILSTDNPSFSYSATAFCQDEANPVASISGTIGGTFTSTAGLVFANASTGEIDLAGSTPGTYTITYTTAGSCPASSDVSVTINAVDDATFSYGSSTYCRSEPVNPTATVGGTTGGTFSSATGLVFANQFTGEIDLTATPAGTHDITYTTSGTCPDASTISLDILDEPGATDQTPVVCEDAAGSGSATVDLTNLESSINADVGLTFNWFTDAALTSSVADPTNVVVGNGDTYYVEVDNGSCQSSAQVTYTVNSLPVVADQTPAVCEDTAGGGTAAVDLTSLEAAIDGGNGFSFTWYEDAGLTTAVADPTNVIVVNGDDFFASVDDGSCTNIASVNYTVNTLPTVSFSGFASPYCETDGIVVLTGNQAPAGTFSGPGITDNGDGTASFDPSAAGQGTFSITYSYTDGNGCTNQSSQSVVVNDCTVPASPNFIADATSICDGNVVTFTDQSSGTITTYSWDFGVGASPATASGPGPHAVTYTGVGSYTVSLTVDGPTTETKVDYITVNAADDPGFAYSATDYCPADGFQLPVSVNTPGGTFTAAPAGLVINSSNGEIDVAASSIGSYTVTYTTTGSCPTSTDVTVNINGVDDPSFTYGSATYCQSDANPSAIITGDAGTFTAPAGLVFLDTSTGEIDLPGSTPGSYTITYNTAGFCPASATFDVTIEAAPNATFSYGSSSYCLTAGNQLPTVAEGGGTFTSTGPAGFLVDAATGEIDPAAGIAGDTYTVTYTINGVACNDTFDFDVSITNAPDATFDYGTLSFCQSDADPSPVFGVGATAGTFTASSSDLVIDPATGVVDLDASVPGTYTVTNTIAAAGACPSAVDNTLIEILEQDDATFSYVSTEICLNEAVNPTPDAIASPGGEFISSDPSNLVVDLSSGEIDLTASSAGVYDITYTTAGTCQASSSISVTLYDAEDASFSYAATEFCFTDANPTATISGLGSGTFSSSDPTSMVVDAATGEIDLVASTAGVYDVTYTTPGTSPGGCSTSNTVSITLNDVATADAGLDGTSCNYDYTFTATTPVSGTGTWTMISTPTGTETSFITDPNDPSSDVQVSQSGTYEFRWEVLNGGCIAADTVAITFQDELEINPIIFNSTDYCGFSIGGVISTSVSGGSGNFSYLWTPSGETDAQLDNGSFSGVPGGVYRLDITDDITGCSTFGVYALPDDAMDFNVTISAVDNSCSGSSNGEIHVSYTTNDFNFTIYDDQRNILHTSSGLAGATEIHTGLAGSTYFVEVEDAVTGCTTGREVLITEPAPVTLASVVINNATCPGASDGSITMDVSGGIAPLSFSWKDATDTEVSTDEDPVGLVAGDYYVDITYGGGCSYTSSIFTIAEPAPSAGPTVNAATAISCSEFSISWSNESVINYEIQVATDNGFTNLVTGYDPYVINDGSTSLTVNSGIAAATTYYYRVRAEDGCGWTLYSAEESVTTDPVTVPVAQAATGVVCDAFNANWNSVGGAVTYYLDVATSNTFDPVDILAGYDNLDVGNVTTLAINGLTPGTTYFYRVRVETGCGLSADSNTEEATLIDVPTAPVNLLSSGETCDTFTADWDAVTGASSYVVEVSSDGFSTIAASATPGTNTATISGLSAGVTYEWRVAAVNGCGNSLWSASQNATTTDLPVVADQTPELCSDVTGGISTSAVDLTGLESSIDVNTSGLTITWYEDAGLMTAVADPTNVTVNNGDDFYAELGSGSCTSVATVSYTVNPLSDASFSYAASPYCQYAPNVIPTITGDAGTFSASSTDLVFADTSTGEIDLTNSVPGTYTITYTTTTGVCDVFATQVVVINAASDPTFSYASGTFCQDAGLQLPTVNQTGGTFSSTGGLVLDATTGEIDPLTSTPATYTITYDFGGSCPTSATFDVTITTSPDATFSYTGSPFCQTDTDPSPVLGAGASIGVFSADAGLVIDPVTGVIDLDASTPGIYNVTNTIAAVGSCPEATHQVSVEILSTDDPTFSYSAAAFCQDEANPVATITGTAGGNFSSTAGLVFADAATGEIDLVGSAPGTYTVTYTTLGACPSSSDVSVTINSVPDPTFNYASATFCQDAGLQSPTVAEGGGTFIADAGLTINATTGEIDPLSSAIGSYDVTYEIPGACTRSGTINVTITGTPDATFSYSAASFCLYDADPAPAFDPGASAGTFTASAPSLIIDPATGVIDVDASTPGSYTVTNTIPALGSCAGDTHDFIVEIQGTEDATFSYDAAAYCQNEANPVPTITGVAGGTFVNSTGLVIDGSTGEIDLLGSPSGLHTVTYTSPATTPGMCAGTFDFDITINEVPDATFSYAHTTFCRQSTTSPTIDGVGTSNFTVLSGVGLAIDASTGEIDLVASDVGIYQIQHELDNGNCTTTETFEITITDQLAAPTGILANAPSCSGFTVNWDAVSGADRYVIEVASDAGFTADVTRDTVSAADLDYTFTTLSTDVYSYHFRMWAIDACDADGVFSAADVFNTEMTENCGCGLDPANASFTVTSENTNCLGSIDGALMVYLSPMSTASPSRFEYSYASATDSVGFVNGGSSTGLVFIADSLSAGDYTVYIRDVNADPLVCDTLLSFNRTISVQNDVAVSSSPASCDAGGSISYSLPSSCDTGILYSFTINNLNSSDPVYFDGNVASNLPEGSYEVVVTNSDTNDTLAVFTESIFSTCSNNGGGSGITCSLGDKTVDVNVTAASCDTGEGSVTFTVIGGETDNYNFRVVSLSGAVDETQLATGSATFNNLPAGEYDYIVIDEAGSPRCESTFRIVENIVVINTVSYQLPACDAPEQTATLGVTLSASTNAPAPYDVFVISGADTVSTGLIEAGTNTTEVGGVPTGVDVNIVVSSRGAGSCPASRIVSVPATGAVDISFDYEPANIVCFGDGGTVTVSNIVVAENTEFTINLMNVDQTQPYMSRIFSAIPSSYTFANLETGDYRVQITQQQSSCGIISTESSPTFTIEGPTSELQASVPETVTVTVNEPYGNILVDSIQGGGLPYEVRIAADPSGGTTDWVEVVNENPVIDPYAFEFRDLEMGTYFIELRDGFGCSRLYEVSIEYSAELYIPNIITPNGDGDNDTFQIVNLESATGDGGARMIITSRWGKVVHQSDNYTNDNAWDGGYNADGMYFYDLLLPDGNRYSGWIEIWRGRTP